MNLHPKDGLGVDFVHGLLRQTGARKER